MPRGSKVCSQCNTETGPRAWNCPRCGFGFTIRGEKKPDLSVVTPQPARLTPETSQDMKNHLWSLVERYNGEDDRKIREKYGMEGKTWQSACGQYRIREQLTFMGVNMRENFSKYIYLLKLVEGTWEIVRPKGRFRSPLAAIRRMLKDQRGLKPKATTKDQKLQSRVAVITGSVSDFDN